MLLMEMKMANYHSPLDNPLMVSPVLQAPPSIPFQQEAVTE
jgi:hypothetical protein